MTFSIKWDGGVWSEMRIFFQLFFSKNYLQSLYDCQGVFCTEFGLYIIYIVTTVVEVTINMKYQLAVKAVGVD